MRSYIEHFAKSRKLSLTTLSEELGYSSSTTLFRLMDATVRKKSLQDFRQRMKEHFSLSAEDMEELNYIVDQKLEGEDFARQNQAIHRFVNCSIESSVPLSVTLSDGTLVGKTLEPFSQWKIILLNACHPAVIEFFKPMVDQGASLDHYLFSPLDMEQTRILLPVLFHKQYRLWYLSSPRGLNGLGAADFALISNGEKKGFMVIQNAGQATLYWQDCPWRPEVSLYYQAKTVTKKCTQLSDYPDFCQYCASLEEGNAVFMLKPDLQYSSISGDLFKRVMQEGPMADDPSFPTIIDTLKDIYNTRFNKTFSRHQHTWLVMKYSGMLHFAETGRLSDHFVGFAPFTCDERKTILRFVLDQMINNPFIHYHFLINDVSIPGIEVDLYEKKGLLIQNQATNYDLSDGCAEEILITSPSAMNQWKEYFIKKLVEEECWNKKKSCAIMEKLIEKCVDQG